MVFGPVLTWVHRIGGSSDTRIYTVVFKGYDSTELLSASEIKPMTDSKKRALEMSELDAEREKKRKKNDKKNETKAVKAAEQLEKQKSWQSFAKKGAKKGVSIPGLVSRPPFSISRGSRAHAVSIRSSQSGESMFASPDNPYGKGKPVSPLGIGSRVSSASPHNRDSAAAPSVRPVWQAEATLTPLPPPRSRRRRFRQRHDLVRRSLALGPLLELTKGQIHSYGNKTKHKFGGGS